jgi:hypothetical protein
LIDPDATNDVLLGFCHAGTVAACFMDSVLAAFAEDVRRGQGNRRLVEYHQTGGPYIHDNRARIARYFLEETDKQWLWMVDNDMDFPVDSHLRLLSAAEKHDCKILGAAYWNQYGIYRPALSWLLLSPQFGIRAIRDLPDETVPVEVNAVGMGCTIIHRDVLQDVADSYPNDPWDTFAADMMVRFEDGSLQVARVPEDFELDGKVVVQTSRMGEDVTFCLRAKKVGYSTWGLPTLIAEHFKSQIVIHGTEEAHLAVSG